ncbi:MAG: hypothetical protein OEZ39_10690 [Gammaproteobacteria bacterium]|nr:hypothetical protein [Gammaproteobacteria bacterium]MDH5652310.1 hypothetical protein [Gammaproteobacteria bacterium]
MHTHKPSILPSQSLSGIGLLFCGLLLVLATGCTGPGVREGSPVFYPPLPNPPRIQHLRSFTALKDLGGGGGFAEFVLGKESNEALINKPYGVAMHNGKIYAVDTRGPGYVVLDLTEKKRVMVHGSGGGRMKKPINITIDKDGNKYVTDTGRGQVLKYDQNDRFVQAYGTEGQFKPGDVVLVDDRMYVSDLKNHLIQVLDKNSGKLLFKMATPDSKEGVVQFPTNMAAYGDSLYVSDTGNFKISKYNLDGKYIHSLGNVGSALGKFARPKGIALDRDGRMYVVDAAFENVQIFNKDGKLLLFFGGPGDSPEHINLPTDIHIDYDNVQYFQQYAAPGFKLEYVIIVASQFGVNKLNIFGFGQMQGMDYSTAQ